MGAGSMPKKHARDTGRGLAALLPVMFVLVVAACDEGNGAAPCLPEDVERCTCDDGRAGFAVCPADGGGGLRRVRLQSRCEPVPARGRRRRRRRWRRRERRGGGARAPVHVPVQHAARRAGVSRRGHLLRLPREGPVLLAPCKEATDCPPPSPGCNMHGRVQGAVRRRSPSPSVSRRCLAPSLALADDPPQPPPPPEPPPAPPPPTAKDSVAEVRVIGDKADALQKVPGSGTLVTTKEIERAAAGRRRGDPAARPRAHGDAAGERRPAPRRRHPRPRSGAVAARAHPRGRRTGLGQPVRGAGHLLRADGRADARRRGREGQRQHPLRAADHRRRHQLPHAPPAGAPPRDGGDRRRLLGRRPVRIERSVPARQRARWATRASSRATATPRPSTSATSCRSSTRTATACRRRRSTRPTRSGKVVFDTSEHGEATLKLGFHDDETHVRRQRADARRCTCRIRASRRASPADRIGQQHYDISITQRAALRREHQAHDDRVRVPHAAHLEPRRTTTATRRARRSCRSTSTTTRRRHERSPAARCTSATPTRSSTATTRWPGVEPRLEWRTRTGRSGAHAQRRRAPPLRDGALRAALGQHADVERRARSTTSSTTTRGRSRPTPRTGSRCATGCSSRRASASRRRTSRATSRARRTSTSPQPRRTDRRAASSRASAWSPARRRRTSTPGCTWAGRRRAITSPISPKTGTDVVQLQAESSINYELGTRLTYKRLAPLRGDGVPHRLRQPGRLVERRSGDLRA